MLHVLEDLQARLEEAKLCGSEEVWAGAVRRSQELEEDYWSTDSIHESVDLVIISLASDDEDEFLLIHKGQPFYISNLYVMLLSFTVLFTIVSLLFFFYLYYNNLGIKDTVLDITED